MGDDRYRPCAIFEVGDGTSLLNEPAIDISLRRELPLGAVLHDVRVRTEALATRLEGGVPCRNEGQREAVRALYLATRRQLEAIAAAVDY
jgi:hypothetical protein